MVAAIVFWPNPRWMLRIPDYGVKVDDTVVSATLPDPLVNSLTHLLFLWIVKGLEGRPGKSTLKRRQGSADNFDPMQVCPVDQLLITRDDFLHSNRFFGRREKGLRPSNIVDTLHDDHVGYAWLAQHVAVESSQRFDPHPVA